MRTSPVSASTIPWALCAVSLLLVGCQYPERDRAIVRRWLKCEECIYRELDSVRARGNRIVPLLREALKGPSQKRSNNMRTQLDSAYTRIVTQAGSEGRAPDLTQSQFVAHYMSNYKASHQSRAITGLSAIATSKAHAALEDALADTVHSDTLYRPDVLQQLIRASDGSWTSISAGSLRTCGIRSDRKSYCWGSNDQGQLGDGTSEQRLRATLIAGPGAASDRVGFISLATGLFGQHTCGISADKVAFCWGENDRGELGDSSQADRLEPTPVAGNLRFTGITVGGHQTCGWTPDYRAYCWGANDAGQLGIGSTSDRLQPAEVAGGHSISRLSAGSRHTCADSLNYRLYCWGGNSLGQLGDGTTTDTTLPVAAAPPPIRIKRLSVGGDHTCVLAQRTSTIPEGAAYCTGNNDKGQLGIGSPAAPPSPPQNELSKVVGPTFLAISAGQKHTCAISAEPGGALYCWGDNQFGQLGDGTTNDRALPDTVAADLRFEVVSAGDGHTCGVTTQGEAYCWGRNDAGQLGDTTVTMRSLPVKVVSPAD